MFGLHKRCTKCGERNAWNHLCAKTDEVELPEVVQVARGTFRLPDGGFAFEPSRLLELASTSSLVERGRLEALLGIAVQVALDADGTPPLLLTRRVA